MRPRPTELAPEPRGRGGAGRGHRAPGPTALLSLCHPCALQITAVTVTTTTATEVCDLAAGSVPVAGPAASPWGSDGPVRLEPTGVGAAPPALWPSSHGHAWRLWRLPLGLLGPCFEQCKACVSPARDRTSVDVRAARRGPRGPTAFAGGQSHPFCGIRHRRPSRRVPGTSLCRSRSRVPCAPFSPCPASPFAYENTEIK